MARTKLDPADRAKELTARLDKLEVERIELAHQRIEALREAQSQGWRMMDLARHTGLTKGTMSVLAKLAREGHK